MKNFVQNEWQVKQINCDEQFAWETIDDEDFDALLTWIYCAHVNCNVYNMPNLYYCGCLVAWTNEMWNIKQRLNLPFFSHCQTMFTYPIQKWVHLFELKFVHLYYI